MVHGDRHVDVRAVGTLDAGLQRDVLDLASFGGVDVHREPVGEHPLISVDQHRVGVDPHQIVDLPTEQGAGRPIHHQDSTGRVDLHDRLRQRIEQVSGRVARPTGKFTVTRPPAEGEDQQHRSTGDRDSQRHLIGDEERRGRCERQTHLRSTIGVTRAAPRTTRRGAP